MQYPMELRFKLLSLANQVSVTDATGQLVMYVRQKMFKFKEHVTVYGDRQQTRPLFEIKADRVIDFSASYHFTTSDGQPWGAVRRRGARSLWSAHYEVTEGDQVDMVISEESPFKKVLEGILGEIPFIGFIFIMLLNPSYIVARPDGTRVMKLTKLAAVFEGKFRLEKLSECSEDDELRAILALIMLVLLERARG